MKHAKKLFASPFKALFTDFKCVTLGYYITWIGHKVIIIGTVNVSVQYI